MKIVNENNNTTLSEAQKQGERPYMPVEEFNLLYRYFQALISKLDNKEYAAHFRRPDQMREYAKGFCDNFHTLLRKIKHEDDLGKTGSLLSKFDYGAFKNPKKLSNMLAKVRDKGENRLSKALNHNSELASMVHKLGNNYIGAVLTCMDELQSKKAVKAALQNESLEEDLDNVEVTDNTVVVPQPMAVAKEESEDLWKKFLDATEEPKDAPLFGAEDQPTPDEVEEPKAELKEDFRDTVGIDSSFEDFKNFVDRIESDGKADCREILYDIVRRMPDYKRDDILNGLAKQYGEVGLEESLKEESDSSNLSSLNDFIDELHNGCGTARDADKLYRKAKNTLGKGDFGLFTTEYAKYRNTLLKETNESLSSKLTLDESLFESKKTLKEGIKEEKAALREVQKQLRRLLIEIKDSQKSVSFYAKGNGNYTDLIDDLYEARNGLLGAIDDIDNLIFEDHQLSSRRNESLKLKEGYSVVDLETGDRFGNYNSVDMAKSKAYSYAKMCYAKCAVIDDRARVICGFSANGKEIKARGWGDLAVSESFKKKLKEANGADGQLFNGQKDIADSFKNYKAFKANFKPVHIVKVNRNYFVYNDGTTDSNSYIYYADNKDNIEGWLYGAVQAKNKRIAEGLKKNKKSINEAVSAPTSYKKYKDYSELETEVDTYLRLATELKEKVSNMSPYEVQYQLRYLSNHFNRLAKNLLGWYNADVEKQFEKRKSAKENFYLKTKNPKKKLNEAYITKDFSEFEPWSGAVEVWNRILDEDKLDDFEFFIDDVYSGVIGETELNDLLRFDSDYVYDVLGMSAEEDVDESLKEALKKKGLNEGRISVTTLTPKDIDDIYYCGYSDGEHQARKSFDNFADKNYEEGTPEYRAIMKALRFLDDNSSENYFAAKQSQYYNYSKYIKDFIDKVSNSLTVEESLKKRNLKEEVSDYAYTIAQRIDDEFRGQGYISWEDFNEAFEDAFSYEEASEDPELSDYFSDESADLWELENDVRGILSYMGWETIFEGEDEGSLKLLESKKRTNKRNLKEKMISPAKYKISDVDWFARNDSDYDIIDNLPTEFEIVVDEDLVNNGNKDIYDNNIYWVIEQSIRDKFGIRASDFKFEKVVDKNLKEASTLPRGGKDEDFDTDAWSVIYWELSADSEDSTSTRNMKKLAKTSANAKNKYERVDPVNDTDLRVYAKDEDGFKLAKKVANAWKVKYEIEPTKKSHQAKFPNDKLQMTIFIPEEMLG